MREYLQRHVERGSVFVGCEGDEMGLAELVQLFGNKPFVYSSDFPHEVTNSTCKEEIQEVLDNPRLTPADKEAILHGNAERLYGLQEHHPSDVAAIQSEATGVRTPA
jgi:predicted TIM-barrel fold metal-dependent hydrolase